MQQRPRAGRYPGSLVAGGSPRQFEVGRWLQGRPAAAAMVTHARVA